jgi:hypothetical protein
MNAPRKAEWRLFSARVLEAAVAFAAYPINLMVGQLV